MDILQKATPGAHCCATNNLRIVNGSVQGLSTMMKTSALQLRVFAKGFRWNADSSLIETHGILMPFVLGTRTVRNNLKTLSHSRSETSPQRLKKTTAYKFFIYRYRRTNPKDPTTPKKHPGLSEELTSDKDFTPNALQATFSTALSANSGRVLSGRPMPRGENCSYW